MFSDCNSQTHSSLGNVRHLFHREREIEKFRTISVVSGLGSVRHLFYTERDSELFLWSQA